MTMVSFPKKFLLEEIDISDVDLSLIETITITKVFEYMNYVGAIRGNKPSTRSRKVSSLRTFFHYLTNKVNLLNVNPILELETPKQKKSLPKHLSLEQSIELLQSVDGEYKERDYCILTLFLNCGLRLSELVSMNIHDVYFEKSEYMPSLKITGKGNKERMVYLNAACTDAIQAYLAVRPKDGVIDKDALFISRNKRRMSPKTVQYMVNKYLDKIGLGGPGYSVQ